MAAAAKSIFAQMEAAVEAVIAAKAKLDASASQVQADSAAHQEAVAAAEAIHAQFRDAVGPSVPSARVR